MRIHVLPCRFGTADATVPVVAMKIEDALRKIRLLRRVTPDNGASDAETENAAAIMRSLMDRFAVSTEDARPPTISMFRLSWVYWDNLLNEYGLELRRFGKRGSATIGRDLQALMRLDSGEWRVERRKPDGAELVAEGKGVETFQTYLSKNAPRMYSLSANRHTVFRQR
jgi:hypothetical protein